MEFRRLTRNRRKAPDSVALAETLFDLARELRDSEIETIAIRVDGLAQDGRNVTREETLEILDRLLRGGGR